MNTNTMELNINEMTQYNGGDGFKYSNPKSGSGFSKNTTNWIDNTFIPATENVGKAVCTVGKAACNWVAGLFS